MSQRISWRELAFLTSCVMVNIALVFLFPPYRYSLGIFVIGAYLLTRNGNDESVLGTLSDFAIRRITIYAYLATAVGLIVSAVVYWFLFH